MVRCTDGQALLDVMTDIEALKTVCVDMHEWAADYNNVALREDDDFGVFEYEKPGLFTGHYFFKHARGKRALALAKCILSEMFTKYGAEVIRGLTPTDHKAALWMNRQLGFKPYGTVETEAGPHQIFVLTKKEFEKI